MTPQYQKDAEKRCREKYLANGGCYICGKPRAKNSKRLCEKHRIAQAAYAKASFAKRKVTP